MKRRERQKFYTGKFEGQFNEELSMIICNIFS